MSNLMVNHCELPIDAPVSCEFLREIPSVSKEGDNVVISVCSYSNSCPFIKSVEHIIDTLIE